MGKKGKGKKGKKGSKKSKKKEKKGAPEEPLPPPDLDTFVCIRRKNLSLCLESFGEETVKDLKVQVATILRQFAEDITLFSIWGKDEPEEMEEMTKPNKEEVKKKDNNRSGGGSRGRGGKKEEKKERHQSPPKPSSRTLSSYGYSAGTATIFNPGIIGLSYRGDDGEFEALDITPYGTFPTIPEEIKMHLRNYVPPPPPPPKKGGKNAVVKPTKK